LAADLDHMAHLVAAGLGSGEQPTVWQARRKQIAVVRTRVRTMRARHRAGTGTSSGTMPPQTPGSN